MRIVPCLVSTVLLAITTQIASQICEIAYRSFPDLIRESSCKSMILDPYLCEKGIESIKNGEFLKFPRAKAGSLPVYMWRNIVIKAFDLRGIEHEPGRESPQSRQNNEMEASRIIEEKGYDRLIVPASCLYESYLINEKIPIMDAKNAELLYFQHPEAFTEAIEQFTRLSIQRSVLDIQFANMVPYFVQKGDRWIGQLALVDLEYFSPTDQFDAWAVLRLFHRFSLHYQEIINILKELPLELKEKVLLQAISSGPLEVAQELLGEADISLEVKENALLHAIKTYRVEVAESLLEEEGISSEIREKAFFKAALSGSLEMVNRLLEEDISSEIKEEALFRVVDQHGLVSGLKIIDRLLKEEDISLEAKDLARKRVLRFFNKDFQTNSLFTTIFREVDGIFSEVQYFVRKRFFAATF